jgi:hypothetical protein
MLQQAFFATDGSPLIAVDSAQFDGTNDFMTRGAGLNGAADGKLGILSAWIRLDGGDAADQTIFQGATTLGGTVSHVRLRRTSANKFEVVTLNAAGSTLFTLTSSSTFTSSATWLHVLSSWDCASTATLYVNDVSQAVVTPTNDLIDYTLADWAVGAQASGGTKVNGCIAEVYFQMGQYLDITLVSNRRKFYSPSGKPVFLGTDGSLPTGTAAISYHHLSDGESVAALQVNRGSGGNYAITGALTTGSTTPSD